MIGYEEAENRLLEGNLLYIDANVRAMPQMQSLEHGINRLLKQVDAKSHYAQKLHKCQIRKHT